ncbi:MAG: GNAT family N-acetyltransferase [Deefgea sp.]
MVRKILPNEYERMAEVAMSSFEHLAIQYQSPNGIAYFKQFASVDAIAARDGLNSVSYVALIQNVIVGVLQVQDHQHIELLFVLSELQSRGVGRALVRVADDGVRLQTVDASVNSVMAFMRYGFMPCGADQIAQSGWRNVPMKRS